MRVLYSVILLFVFVCLNAQNDYTQFVKPIVGTGGHGHTFPGATLPFAMVQLSPDTRIDGSWDGCSGYHYSDSIIYGFSHTHLSGTGCSDYGDIAYMPSLTTGKLMENIAEIENLSQSFRHANEVSKAGYYSVLLDNGVKVELTSTTRTGLQQYTYIKAGYTWITLNLKHRDELLEGKITEINKHSFSGFRRSKAWAEDQLVYYYFEINRDAEQIVFSRNEKGETKVNLGFKVIAGEKILIKTALSSADEEGAKGNMIKELPHWNFEKVKTEANAAWNLELNRIKAYGGTKDERTNFYTALYHCMIHPNIMNDVDGRYMGRDKKIHKADGFNYYTVFSLWDTYRALHPLLNIIDKKRSHDFIMTFKAQYEQSGRLPMWELWGNETNCMIGFHSVSVILDAYNKEVISMEELRDIYPGVKAEAMSNRFGLDKYRAKGYLSIEDESESVSKTLEYAYDFSCVSSIASILNLMEDGAYFGNLSKGYQNVRDINTGFMRPRKNGGWLSPFDPKQVNNHYTEANAWQYTFSVQHEPWMVQDQKKISTLFNEDSKTTGRDQSDITGMIGQYAQGNEPSHHIPYLFNNIDSTAKYVKQICKTLYQPTADGLCGNEDCGQMSAWYVFSAMGFYPVNPSAKYYFFGAMIFDSVKIKSNDHNFELFRKMDYVKNKASYKKFKQQEFNTFSESSTFWLETNRPNIYGYDVFEDELAEREQKYFIASPIVVNNNYVFEDSLKIELVGNDGVFIINFDGIIYYQVDDGKYQPYVSPFYIHQNSRIKSYKTFKNNGKSAAAPPKYEFYSDTSISYFYKKPNNYSIKISSIPNKQYTADGEDALLDGLRGDTDWRKGRWQGYQSQDFEAVIDMKELKKVNKISAGFLQDTRSWILMPTKVVFYGSNDSLNFEELGVVANVLADSNLIVQSKEFEFKSNSKQFRYIKVKAKNYGVLPKWHQGAGGDAFIFVDEIKVE